MWAPRTVKRGEGEGEDSHSTNTVVNKRGLATKGFEQMSIIRLFGEAVCSILKMHNVCGLRSKDTNGAIHNTKGHSYADL